MLPVGWRILPLMAAVLAAAPSLGRSGAGAGRDQGVGPLRASASVASGPGYGAYAWPVQGVVIRPFDPPDTAYGSGHRGIDIAAQTGTPVRGAADGVVAFAGRVAGALYVSVDHADGVRTTYSWLGSVAVGSGQTVGRGDLLGTSGPGHPGVEPAHLHFGARYAGAYIDPMLLLEGGSLVGLIHLAPLDGEPA